MPTPIIFLWAVTIAFVATFFPTAFASYADVQDAGLAALYISTNGQEWTTSTGWQDSVLVVCSRFGVTCDGESGNVTGLSLSSNGLVGDLSQTNELASVTSLEEVDLSDNFLSGPVPLSFGLLPRLKILDLSGNQLTYFPATWGSGALALQYLSVQSNRLSGSFPADWLEVNDTSTYPLVHGQSVSPWFPELRSLLLGGNHINTTGYTALQTIVNWKSIQTLDLSENALTGSVEDALTLFYCHESGGAECGANISSVAAPMLRVLKLDGNTLTGRPPQAIDAGERRIEVLDVSDNSDMSGVVPGSYSELLMLFAGGTRLSGSNLPTFLEAATGTPGYESTNGFFVCPALQPPPNKNTVAVTLDPSYDGYSVCTCDDGYEALSGSCSKCPVGWYRSIEVEEDLPSTCLECPSASTTLQEGDWLKSQCVCSANFYDELVGLGSGPSCVVCPSGSRTPTAGATTISSCECGPGYVLNITSSMCEACIAGTYKPVFGSQVELCLPCPTGSYSETVGAMSSSVCEACPLGFYGDSYGASTLADCKQCPAGTYASIEGLPSVTFCTTCWAGFYSPTLGANSSSTCIECPYNHSQPNAGAGSLLDCILCSGNEVSGAGSSQCSADVPEDGTLIGLYLLIAGIILVVFTLLWVFLQKHCGGGIPVKEKVHMKLNEEMSVFIKGQQFWISLFSGVEIMDLMSDLGAYASLLYNAVLTGTMKIIYTIVVAFALMASLHGVHTRAIIILDMQEERTHGLAITGNNMLYYEKQFSILQIMTQKRTCRRHVPFDRGNKYLSHHIGVQRLISLNSMRIIIAIFEDVPFLGLNMYLLMREVDLANNPVFMMSFVLSIFVLGYKMTLLEKHARLQIRKWNLEARMDTDTMLNKKAAGGRRFSWACQQCEAEGVSQDTQKELTRSLLASSTQGSDIGKGPPARAYKCRGSTTPTAEGMGRRKRRSNASFPRPSSLIEPSPGGRGAGGDLCDSNIKVNKTESKYAVKKTHAIDGNNAENQQHEKEKGTPSDTAAAEKDINPRSNASWNTLDEGENTKKNQKNGKSRGRSRNKKVLPFEGNMSGEGVTGGLILPDQELSTMSA